MPACFDVAYVVYAASLHSFGIGAATVNGGEVLLLPPEEVKACLSLAQIAAYIVEK